MMGGSERVLLDLAQRLDGHAAIACPDGWLAARARAAGVRVFSVRRRRLELRASLRDRVSKPLRIAGHAMEVRRLTVLLRPQLVFAWGTRAAIACAAALEGTEPRPALVFQNNDFLQGPVIARVARAAAARADAIVAPSAAVARDFDPRGALEDRSLLIPPGIDVSAYYPDAEPAEPPEVLLLGALVGWKRPRVALEAVALAAREIPDLRLTIAGPVIDSEGERLADALRRRAQQPDLAGRVDFAGTLDDPRGALSRASCLIHCADREPFGMVLVEALASGRPVVAPAEAGPEEIVDSSCGRLFRPGDPRSAAEALVEVLGTPGLAAELGEAGRERAESLFDVDGSSSRYAELIEELTAAPDRAAATVTQAGSGMAIVTVLHDSQRELAGLLDSASSHLPGAHLVAVDSGSRDAGPALAREWTGRSTVIELGENAGFGRGSNAGLEAVDAPVTAIVNPDVELLDSSLESLAEEVLRDDRPERILAPLVLLTHGVRQDTAHHEPGSAADVVRALVPPSVLPPAVGALVEPWRSNRPRRTGWAVGCCIVARTETLRRLGPFDPNAFLYAEDLDLCLRAADAGIETWFWPTGRVLHHAAHASKRVFGGEPLDLLAERRREVVRRWRGARRQSVDDWLLLATYANRLALKRMLGRSADRERRQIAALRSARRRQR
jgi:N-acetylglucosaminyl-diphospho-decaprenol L-rhamnosyltransferase